jgi:hypothetical protein
MVVDVSAVSYFAPIFSFLLVFIVVFAVLYKTEFLGELLFVQLLTSFIVAALFISVASVKQYVVVTTAWFGVLAVSLFFLLFLLNFIGKWKEHEGIGIVVVILLCLIFIVSFLKVFGGIIGPYLPGSSAVSEREPGWMAFFDWLYSSQVIGALILIIVCVIVSWVLVKAKE